MAMLHFFYVASAFLCYNERLYAISGSWIFMDLSFESSNISIGRTGYSFNTITLETGSVEELETFLQKKIDPSIRAYDHTPVVLDVSHVDYLQNLEYDRLVATCKLHGLYLIGLSGIHSEERALFLHKRDIPIVNSVKFSRMREENFKPKVITKTVEIEIPVHIKEPYPVKVPYKVLVSEPMMLIKRSIRSGESISAVNNSVLIIGNVAPTARIIASHHVFIFGDLHGEVFAGSPRAQTTQGFDEAIVYTSGKFAPTLLAIAGNYQTAEDMEQSFLAKNLENMDREVLVFLHDGVLTYTHAKDSAKLRAVFNQ
jgi:septum site-determining protein MinC